MVGLRSFQLPVIYYIDCSEVWHNLFVAILFSAGSNQFFGGLILYSYQRQEDGGECGHSAKKKKKKIIKKKEGADSLMVLSTEHEFCMVSSIPA